MTDASYSADPPNADDTSADGVDLNRTPLAGDPFKSSDYVPGALRVDLYGNPVDRDPYFPDPTLDGGQVLYHMGFGAKPEDFHPALQPLARGYSIAFEPQAPLGPGVLGSLDDIKAAAAATPASGPADPPPVQSVGPHDYRPEPGDANLLARILYAESAEIPGDFPAIAWSTVNRANTTEFGKTLSDVVNQTNRNGVNAYASVADGGSPEWLASANPEHLTGLAADRWAQAVKIANGVLNGSIADPTSGATFFFASPDYQGEDFPGTAKGGFFRSAIGKTIHQSPYHSTSNMAKKQYFFIENRPARTAR